MACVYHEVWSAASYLLVLIPVAVVFRPFWRRKGI